MILIFGVGVIMHMAKVHSTSLGKERPTLQPKTHWLHYPHELDQIEFLSLIFKEPQPHAQNHAHIHI